MAEILLSLTIIGVVAAITLPSLTGNINERTWNTQRKALYARMSQAISLMPALNGYGTLEEGDPNNVAETFITSGLSKVLKINNICNSEHLEDCGIPPKITTFPDINGSSSTRTLGEIVTLIGFNERFNFSDGGWTYSQQDTKAAAFETVNAESILVYYNPRCSSENYTLSGFFTQTVMCANFVYDLNGNKGPNTVGKDIGVITVFNATDPIVVAPVPTPKINPISVVYEGNVRFCREQSNDTKLPNKYELMSIFVNRNLFNFLITDAFSSSMAIGDSTRSWRVTLSTGHCALALKTHPGKSICIKR